MLARRAAYQSGSTPGESCSTRREPGDRRISLTWSGPCGDGMSSVNARARPVGGDRTAHGRVAPSDHGDVNVASRLEGSPLRALAFATSSCSLTTTGWRGRGREVLAQLDVTDPALKMRSES